MPWLFRRRDKRDNVPMHRHPHFLADLTTNELRELLKDVDTPAQVIAQRVALLQAIVGPASLTNVRLAGRHAHITGTRARYRVHLGSGVIHVEPAGTLVVRAEPVQPITAPLPFADGDDAKAPEIVAKVLLLADDAAIPRPPAMLAQLPAAGASTC